MYRTSTWLSVVVAVAACCAARGGWADVSGGDDGAGGPGPKALVKAEHAPGRVLVGLKAEPKPKLRSAQAAQALKARDAQVHRQIEQVLPGKVTRQVLRARYRQVVVMELAPGQTVEQVVRQDWKTRDARIEYVEPDYLMHALTVPNDPLFSQQWDMNNTGQSSGTPDADVDAPEAWGVTTNGAGVVVGLIDTGIDYSHPDLAANIWTDTNGNHGYDAITGDADPSDANGHGTHCAGTIGAIGNNGIGVAGEAWSAQIMGLRFLNAAGLGYTSDAVEAVQYGVDHGARILSNSWGGGGYSQALYDAIADARDADVLFIAAAGNSGMDNDRFGQYAYPASYDLDNIISVASTDGSDSLSQFSNYGRNSVDLAAPGGYGSHDARDILSTWPAYIPLFSEDFQSVTPPNVGGFTKTGSNNHWGTVDSNGSIYAVADYDHDPFVADADGSLETPAFDTTAMHGLRLRFDYIPADDTAGTWSVEAWNGSNWSALKCAWAYDGWFHCIADLKTCRNSQMKVRFRWTTSSSASGPALIDNVLIEYIGTNYDSAYATIAGTSMATPHVAGAAALVWTKFPSLDYAGVKARLMETVDPLTSLDGKCVSGGRLNLYNALAPVRNVTQGTWYQTIQAAITAASSGDQIIVSPGTYNEHVAFGGKNVTVQSMDPENPAIVDATIIDGSANGAVVTFAGTESSSATLSGLTITNGYSDVYNGGGIRGNGAYATISHCVIRNNVVDWTYGDGNGGGIDWIRGAISDCTIRDNSALEGGGINGCTNVTNCTFTGNHAIDEGGGADRCRGTITNCVFAGNQASYGGAVANSGTYRNCLMVGNQASSGGGAVYVENTMALSNCTLVGNSGVYGGGICVDAWDAAIAATNCIVWGNTATTGSQIAVFDTLTISYGDVQGGQAGVYVSQYATLNWGSGNINADPLFVSPNGLDDNAATWQDNDYHLQATSPCIDAGDPAGSYTGQTDLDGLRRVSDGNGDGATVADIGAYELFSVVIQSEPPFDGTLCRTQNNAIHLIFPGAISLPPGNPVTIQQLISSSPETLGADQASQFTYSLDTTFTTDDTLTIVETGTVLSNQVWYRIKPTTGFPLSFTFDVGKLVGDITDDGYVDYSDALVLFAYYGQASTGRVDLSTDGCVDVVDLSILSAHYNQQTPAKP